MTREEREKAIDALKISVPIRAATQEEFNDYIQTLNKVMDWLEQEPCEDCVSRVWIREHLGEFLRGCRAERTYEEIAEDVEAYIGHAPPITPKPKTGKWIMRSKAWKEYYVCSACGYGEDDELTQKTKYCPNCGAKMEPESENK